MQDMLLDDTGDLLILNNDVVLGESSEQHQRLLLQSTKGDWKEQPTVGVNAPFYLKDDDKNGLMGSIKTEFEKDGLKVNKIIFSGSKINIDASYSN
jgi:hypothetical protein